MSISQQILRPWLTGEIVTSFIPPYIDITKSPYNAVGDGITNESGIFQNALNDLKAAGGGTLILGGTPRTFRAYQLQCRDFPGQLNILGNGSTLKTPDTTGIVAGTDWLLELRRCEGIRIENLTLDGNRDNRGTYEQDVPAHNLNFYDVARCTLIDVVSKDSAFDGFYLAAEPGEEQDPTRFTRHITFINCQAVNNRRQGITIINTRNIQWYAGALIDTNGTAPGSGADVEPNAGSTFPANEGVLFSGALIEGNEGYGVQVTPGGIKNVTAANNGGALEFTHDGSYAFPDGVGVVFESSADDLAGGVAERTIYFVVNSTSTTAQIALTKGGAALPFSTAGSAQTMQHWVENQGIVIDSCVINGNLKCGVYAGGHVIVTNSQFRNYASVDELAIVMIPPSSPYPACHVMNNRFADNSAAVNCIYASASSGGAHVISRNEFDKPFLAIACWSHDCLIEGNQIWDAVQETSTISIRGRNNTLRGNTFIRCKKTPVYVQTPDEDPVSIYHNSFIDCDQSDGPGDGLVRVWNGIADIQHNTFYSETFEASNIGVRLQSTIFGSRCCLNVFAGLSNSPINDQGTGNVIGPNTINGTVEPFI